MSMFQTVMSLRHLCLPGAYASPEGFVLGGWANALPIQSIVYLHEICAGVMLGRTKEETIADIKALLEYKRESAFHDFDASPPRGKLKREIFDEEREQALEQRAFLERNGYRYPQTVEDCVELFKAFHIVHEIVVAGEVYFDVIISPFPVLKHYLK
ncbi:hypothetical protein J2T17_004686 [Paenibacillus mucilaginosus]|uniref:DUF6042 family protein n=1 Tax=Paenibacillus mucilaginosus TaxID=61624 RepID=UPI003D22B881